MNIEDLRKYCLGIKGASESFPFNDTVLVFKVMGKMFLYIDLEPKDEVFKFNSKCDPDRSIELREQYEGILPGWHTSKKLWNTVVLDSDVPNNLIKELINHSVEQVILNLSKKKQEEYNTLANKNELSPQST